MSRTSQANEGNESAKGIGVIQETNEDDEATGGISTIQQQSIDVPQTNGDDEVIGGISRVHEWRMDVYRSRGMNGTLAGLYTSSCELYRHFLQNLRNMETPSECIYRQLESGLTQLIIWGDDHRVESGSLDTLLEKSWGLRKFTIKLLIRICAILQRAYPVHTSTYRDEELQQLRQTTSILMEEGSYAVHSTDTSDSGSDISDGEDPDTESEPLEDFTETLTCEIGILIDLGPRLEEPVPDFSIEKLVSPEPPSPWEPADYFTGRIMAKFPQCDSRLAIALGKTNWNSIQRRHTMPVSGNELGLRIDALELAYKTAPFRDSGLGTSLQTGCSSAATVVSYRKDGVTRARIPPLPSYEEGRPFECVACRRYVCIRDTKTWKRHLLADLRPWVCCQTSCSCVRTPFKTREEWVGHMRWGHTLHPEWDDKTCPICLHIIADGGITTISHVARHLEEISLASLPVHSNDGDENTSRAAVVSFDYMAPTLAKSETFDKLEQEDPTQPSISTSNDHRAPQAKTPGDIEKSTSTYLGSGRDKSITPIWFCCQCRCGPMTVVLTPECIDCGKHRRCNSCSRANITLPARY